MSQAWIGVDLDGTLAHYDSWQGDEIGKPVPAMIERVREWVHRGINVKIMTARACGRRDDDLCSIRAWCRTHIGFELPITCEKDYGMIELWDDRAISVERNTGKQLGGITSFG